MVLVLLSSCSFDVGRLRAPTRTDAGVDGQEKTPDGSVPTPDGPQDFPEMAWDASHADRAAGTPDVKGAGDGPTLGPLDGDRNAGDAGDEAADAETGSGSSLDAPSGIVDGEESSDSGSGAEDSPGGMGGNGGEGGTGGVGGTGGADFADGAVTGTGGVAGSGGATGTAGTGGMGGVTDTGGSTSCTLGAFQAPEALSGFDLETYNHWGPSLSSDGKTLYFGATAGPGKERIYVATRPDRGTTFSKAVEVSEVNSVSGDGSPCISNDGLVIFFTSSRPGGLGQNDLWSASRSSLTGSFGTPKRLAVLNGPNEDRFPWVSADGLTILFSSSRSGAFDLYVATRDTPSGDFSPPSGLPGVNGQLTREERAALSNDALVVYFVSDRPGGAGGKDLWMGTRTKVQASFSSFTALDALNSIGNEADLSLSRDETELLFVSNRSGNNRLYRSLRTCQ